MTPQVLVVSRDPMLLQTRQLILGAFFQVHGAGRVGEAEALMARFSFDLIILCSTLGDSDCRAVMDLVADRKQHPKILVVPPFRGEREEFLPGYPGSTSQKRSLSLLYRERVEQQKPSFVAVVIVEGGSGAGSFLIRLRKTTWLVADAFHDRASMGKSRA